LPIAGNIICTALYKAVGDRLLGLKLLLTLLCLLLGLSLVSLLVGQATTGLWQIAQQDPAIAWLILTEIRVPRTLLAICTGASLGLAGAVLQGLLRNPLADPSVIGAVSGASLGAVITFYFGLASVFTLALPLGGVAGAFIALGLLYLLAGRDPDALTLILAGVAVNAFNSALTALALNLAPNPYAAAEIVFWLLGSLADRSHQHVLLAVPIMAIGWVLLLSVGRALDALTLGEETASSLGIHLTAAKARAIIGTALVVGATTAVAGSIGFVGLVVPHLLRPFVGHQPGRLLLTSAVGGAVLLLLADIFVRAITTAHGELKLGVVTALVGAPFFVYVLQQMRSR